MADPAQRSDPAHKVIYILRSGSVIRTNVSDRSSYQRGMHFELIRWGQIGDEGDEKHVLGYVLESRERVWTHQDNLVYDAMEDGWKQYYCPEQDICHYHNELSGDISWSYPWAAWWDEWDEHAVIVSRIPSDVSDDESDFDPSERENQWTPARASSLEGCWNWSTCIEECWNWSTNALQRVEQGASGSNMEQPSAQVYSSSSSSSQPAVQVNSSSSSSSQPAVQGGPKAKRKPLLAEDEIHHENYAFFYDDISFKAQIDTIEANSVLIEKWTTASDRKKLADINQKHGILYHAYGAIYLKIVYALQNQDILSSKHFSGVVLSTLKPLIKVGPYETITLPPLRNIRYPTEH